MLFDPYSYDAIRNSIRTELERQPLMPLSEAGRATGAGIYAIYYRGEKALYSAISTRGACDAPPIYAGKTTPAGGRVGALPDDAAVGDRSLARRLREHAASIRAARGLEIAEFGVRYLVMWHHQIALGEDSLIRHYRPVWNCVLSGFGNHDPGKGRLRQECSDWDRLHPGRPFASGLPTGGPTAADLQERVATHIRTCGPNGAREGVLDG